MRIRTVLPSMAAVLLLLAATPPAAAAPTPQHSALAPGSALPGRGADRAAPAAGTFTYVYGRQSVDTDGAAVTIDQAAPTLATADYHSLAELAVQSADGQQIVEIGWTVDRAVNNGDTGPHLFVYHWVDRQESCYNGCGFVPTSNTVHAGDPVTPGVAGRYEIVHAAGQWQTWYDGTEVGYFPDSLWGNGYTRAGLVQAFGEVAASSAAPCTDMGNGTFGDASGSTAVSGFALDNGSAPAQLSVADTNSAWYDHGGTTGTSFRFGGPGAC
ncbi:hypothetical protein Athai_01920 [Actinocatenispora thailandica]|uniref:Neprosin PEP catalytic domain-containing protein n=1 Tax=Actinocatenispora thailandica TaxID=227318 RepID=A0A7R7HVA8_9ACTN|nr:neprosin family prolyl endopeptidase [Actinocatenispora thailandica]BCJ32689.1 hypothetical protein Athai_01920 [Actinocatenispora thailandica]